jgi:putative ABC transport system substrate-binding protein
MKRREFITLLGGAAAAWPLAAHAQQPDGVRRIGVLMAYSESDREGQANVAAFRQGLQKLGWTDGRNLRIDTRWAALDAELMQRYAKELIALQPDLILSSSTPTTATLLHQTRTIPIIFASLVDPVGSGVVPSLARPGGHITGFTAYEPAISGKWLTLLKDIAPSVRRVALIYNPETGPFGESFWRVFEASAPSFAVEPVKMAVRGAAELRHAIDDLAREPGGGLLGVPELTINLHRELVMGLAAKHRLPAIYPYRYFAIQGGLASYGESICKTCGAAPRPMSIASSRARSRPICRCRLRPSSNS